MSGNGKNGNGKIDNDTNYRSHLPIMTPHRDGPITYDAKDPEATYPKIEQLRRLTHAVSSAKCCHSVDHVTYVLIETLTLHKPI